MISDRPMPSIHESLASGVPSLVGRIESPCVIPGVFRYSWVNPAPKAVSAAPASADGTNGSPHCSTSW